MPRFYKGISCILYVAHVQYEQDSSLETVLCETAIHRMNVQYAVYIYYFNYMIYLYL